jgi:hypothetical protein
MKCTAKVVVEVAGRGQETKMKLGRHKASIYYWYVHKLFRSTWAYFKNSLALFVAAQIAAGQSYFDCP